jgi:superfamily II DNA or RNA helicase
MLYVVYGHRNEKDGVVSYANVGFTDRKFSGTGGREMDLDYRRKAAGGNWIVITEELECDNRQIEAEVHKSLMKKGFRADPDNTGNTEEFEFNMTPEQIESLVACALHEVTFGVARPNSYKMRPHQQDCHDKAVRALTILGYDSYLIGAVMRFGKTFVAYQIMKSLGAKTTIIVTYKPNDVIESWRNELNDHIDFDDYEFFNAKDTNYEDVVSCEKKVVLFVSAQYLINESGSKNKDWIYNINADILYFDEQHYGGNTENLIEKVSLINAAKKIELSGTPYKTYARGVYPEECIFRYSKIDLRMKTFCIDMAEGLVDDLEDAGFTDEGGFNINKFFTAENGGFIFPRKVERTMVKIFDLNPFVADSHLISPFAVRGLDRSNLDHILIRLPGVQSCIAMKELLSKFIGHEYHIINAAGQGADVVTNSRALIQLINNNKKTITLTCGRFETGITVPQWGAVFMLHGGESPESYFQTVYRACSKNDAVGKKEFYVFDFDPSRALELAYSSSRIMKKDGESLEDAVSDYFDCASIYMVKGNKFAEINSEELIQIYENTISVRDPAKAISSEYGMSHLNLNASAIKALADVSAAKAKTLQTLMHDNGMTKGSIKKGGSKKTQKEKDDLKTLKKVAEKMKTVCSRIPLVIVQKEFPDLQSLLDSTDSTGYFKNITGVTLSVYRDMVQSGALKYDWQNDCIIRIYNGFSTIRPEFY